MSLEYDFSYFSYFSKSYKKMDETYCNMKLYGVLTIGPKGQIVIPKDIREKLDIKTGDSLAVIVKDDKYLGFVKNQDMGELMQYINSQKK